VYTVLTKAVESCSNHPFLPQRAKHSIATTTGGDHKKSTRVSNAKEQTMPVGSQPNNEFITKQATTHEFPFPLTAALTQPPATAQNMTAQDAQATVKAPDASNVIAQSASTTLQQLPGLPVQSGAEAQQDTNQPAGLMQSEIAALISSMRDDHAAKIAAEKQARAAEVGGLKASAVLARQEYLQALNKIKDLEAEVYDLRVGKSAV